MTEETGSGRNNERRRNLTEEIREEMGEEMISDKNIKAVIFDLDGTLLYTLEDLKNSLNYTLRQYKMPERTLEETRRFVGNGLMKLLERATPADTPESVRKEMYQVFKTHYDAHCLDATKPYEGVPELLERLKDEGYLLAIVSNKVDSAVKELARQFFPQVDAAIGERPGVRPKPAPDTVQEALAELEAVRKKREKRSESEPDRKKQERSAGTDAESSVALCPEDCIYVGDSEVDLATAKAAGMPCISVLWGFREKEELLKNGADRFAEKPEDVSSMICRSRGSGNGRG